MHAVRTKYADLAAMLRVRRGPLSSATIAILCALALLFVCGNGRAAEQSVRAQAIVTANRLAEQADTTLRALPRVAYQLRGLRGRIEAEHALALTNAALWANTLADVYWEAMADDAGAAGDGQTRAVALNERVQSILANGDYSRGRRINDELMRIAQTEHSDWLMATAEEYAGVLDRRQGRIDSANDHQNKALALFRRVGDAAGEATTLTNLGTIAHDRGDFAQCLDYFLQALAIRRRIDDRLDVAYRNVALLYRELDDTQTTRTYFELALSAAKRYAQPEFYSSVQGAYAGFLNNMHEYAAALTAANEALTISEVLGNHPSVGFEDLEVGRALLGLDRDSEAAPHFNEALAIGREIGQRELIARSALSLAEIALANGDKAQTHRLLDEVSPLLDASGLKPYLAQAYQLHDRLAESENDLGAAHTFTHLHAALREELLGVRSTRLLAAIEIRRVREQSQQQLDLAERTNELQAERLERSRVEQDYGLTAIAALIATVAVFAVLLLRLRRLNQALGARNEHIERQRGALTEANHELERQARSLYQTTITDALTGADSRSHTLSQLARMLADCRLQRRDMTLLLIDFDHFKLINDRLGHLAGDRFLATAARIIRSELGRECLFGRFGGEEFIVAFADRDADASRELAERIRRAVAERMAGDPPTTISIGGAMLSRTANVDVIDPLIDAADHALYAAKQAGRNQVKGFDRP